MNLPANDDEVLLLHNPRCSNSRATELLLTERGVSFVERRYLEEPLTREELEELGRRLDRAPGEWVRRGQAEFAAAGLEASSPPDRILDALVEHPVLLERPIVVRGMRAVVGRPPTDVLVLF